MSAAERNDRSVFFSAGFQLGGILEALFHQSRALEVRIEELEMRYGLKVRGIKDSEDEEKLPPEDELDW